MGACGVSGPCSTLRHPRLDLQKQILRVQCSMDSESFGKLMVPACVYMANHLRKAEVLRMRVLVFGPVLFSLNSLLSSIF